MRLRVKREQTAYVHNRRYREGQVVDVPEKMFRKADQAYLEGLEKRRGRDLGAGEAKKHGLKVGSLILPEWAELPNKPVSAAPGIPGMGAAGSPKGPVVQAPPPEGLDPEDEAEEAAGSEAGEQTVL